MGVFFVGWPLWEEMTFVLACAIVVVFLVGLFKLWRTSRQMCRQEVLDEEKRARLAELRKVGLPASAARRQRNSDIPFGVRALQTGVEVDGIWISRPTTPSRSSSKSKVVERSEEGRPLMGSHASPAPFAGDDAAASMAARPCSDSALLSGSSSTGGRRAPPQRSNHASPSPASYDALDAHSNMSTPLPQIAEDATVASAHRNAGWPPPATQAESNPRAAGGRGSATLSTEALRRLEGAHTLPLANSINYSSSSSGGGRRSGSGTAGGRLRSGPPQLGTDIPSARMSSPSPSPSLSLSPSRSPSPGPSSRSSHSSTSSRQQTPAPLPRSKPQKRSPFSPIAPSNPILFGHASSSASSKAEDEASSSSPGGSAMPVALMMVPARNKLNRSSPPAQREC